MTTEKQDLSSFAAFDLDDLLAEIETKNASQKEVTAYLDREFITNMIKDYQEESLINKPDFTNDSQIDFTDYNFTGADLRSIKRKDLELFNFHNCDITSAHLDRISLEFFREYMLNGTIIFQGLNLEKAYLGPTFTRRVELGIECYLYLNLSNLNLSGSNFAYADLDGVILENTNISACNFIGVRNLDLKQFAFTMGFETAIFSKNKTEDQALKSKIKAYADTLDPAEYYAETTQKSTTKFITYLANLTNMLDD